MQAHRRGRCATAHREGQGAGHLIPVGALEDAALALEPAAVCLGDVLGARGEDVEHEPAARFEQRARGPQGAQLLRLVGHVQERAEWADHEGHPFLHGRLAQIADAEIDQALDAPLDCERSRNGQHPLGLVDPDDPDARLGDRNGDPPRTGRELHHRPSRAIASST